MSRPPAIPGAKPTPTILIVDDELPNRKLLEMLLQPEGYLTVSVASGDQALEAVPLCMPDLILLDVMMPGMDGYQVAAALKSNPLSAHIPIIMVTAHSDRSARLAGLEAGAEDFLTKPVDRAELWLRVRNLLRLKAFGDFLKNHSELLEQQVLERSADLLRFRSAMDATADAIMLIDRATMRFIEVNSTSTSMLGYPRDELLRMGPAQLNPVIGENLEQLYDALIAAPGSYAMEETQLRCKDGAELHVEVRRHAQQSEQSGAEWIIVCVLSDITERKKSEESLHRMAHYDALTGLPNRRLFYETLRKTLKQAKDSGWLVGVLCIDIDHFKNINDTLGHASGDDLLMQLGSRLMQCIRIRDTVARLGGDEFALMLVMQDDEGAAAVARKIREALRQPFDLQGQSVNVSASIGITIYPADGDDAETLLKYADTAMYHAKQAGRDTYRFFTAQMNDDVLERLDLEKALRKAVDNNEFVLHYQPKVQIDSGRITGVEALLRWQRPGHGLISPYSFIPVLEDTGLIVQVGNWVISTACRQISEWMQSSIGPLQISVNVAGRQFIEGDLESRVIAALQAHKIPAHLLELELTESSLMLNVESTIATMQNLRNIGVQISIDDFGTGYSSLAYLRRFPVDKLKIDIAFIRDITQNPDAAAIAQAIIQMAQSLKLEVIAEGVETAAQLEYLRKHGCNHIQGYYFSAPLTVAELEAMLLSGKCLQKPVDDAGAATKTLLLVDDEPHVLLELQSLLRQDGYDILSALSGAEALELLALNSVQVILSDQHMPSMSGTAFLNRVKDMYPDTLRIVLSDHTDLEVIMEAINRGGVHRFSTKPWDGKILRGNIHEAFRHYSLLHSHAEDLGATMVIR